MNSLKIPQGYSEVYRRTYNTVAKGKGQTMILKILQRKIEQHETQQTKPVKSDAPEDVVICDRFSATINQQP